MVEREALKNVDARAAGMKGCKGTPYAPALVAFGDEVTPCRQGRRYQMVTDNSIERPVGKFLAPFFKGVLLLHCAKALAGVRKPS